jgi:hypothetical protein
VERQEHRPYKSNLKSHFELESSEDQWETKCPKDANRDIRKMAKPP